MPYKFDAEIAPAIAAFREFTKDQNPAVHDVDSRRKNLAALVALAGGDAGPSDVTVKEYSAETADGYKLPLYWYTKNGSDSTPGPAVIHFHGGGMIFGKVPEFRAAIANYVSASGVPFLSVDYRLAPEHPHPTQVEDAYTGLTWLRDHVQELNVDPKRVAVFGESAGGGIAAGLALLARDRRFSLSLAKQILIYPMIDDRRVAVEDEDFTPFTAFWSHEDNLTGWGALLGKDNIGADNVSEYAAPARAKDLSNLPETYIDVGGLDLFRDHNIEYARRLAAAQVTTEFHLYPGLPHGFEGLGPQSTFVQRAMENRIRALKSF